MQTFQPIWTICLPNYENVIPPGEHLVFESDTEFNNIEMCHLNFTANTRINRELNSTISYLRNNSLPSYEDVMGREGSRRRETPPPEYDEIESLL